MMSERVEHVEEEMTIAISIDCNLRERVPRGERKLAVARLEGRIQGEFGEFQRHLAEQGIEASFSVRRR